MPLPPALAARLARRGLVDSVPREEIIAEDYDEDDGPPQYDYDEPARKPKENPWTENIKKRLTAGQITGYKSCPNKCNIYHKCSLYCVTFWSNKEKQPSAEYFVRKKRLLKRHPLPKNWVEVFDIGCAAHYYWNTMDDTVSWLPPGHPEAKVTKSAAAIRKEMEEDGVNLDDNSQEPSEGIASVPLPSQKTAMPPPVLAHMSLPPPATNKPRNRDLDKAIRPKQIQGRYKPPSMDVLDPMDPASYSDIPRGKWSDGLEQENKKSGVDSTVVGTAFQQRPYPSPGAILAAQRKRKGSDDGGEEDSDRSEESDAGERL